jgi:preprotein translocase SecE subunit
MKKKEEKLEKVVKSKAPKEKKEKKEKKEGYFKGVNKELKMVSWPSFKEVMKYTISTIIFCVVICVFFILLNLLMSWVKGMFI